MSSLRYGNKKTTIVLLWVTDGNSILMFRHSDSLLSYCWLYVYRHWYSHFIPIIQSGLFVKSQGVAPMFGQNFVDCSGIHVDLSATNAWFKLPQLWFFGGASWVRRAPRHCAAVSSRAESARETCRCHELDDVFLGGICSSGHLPVISGYKWDYTFYKWGDKYL